MELKVKESLLSTQRDRESAQSIMEQPLPSGIYLFYWGSFNRGVGLSNRGRNIQDLSGKGMETSQKNPEAVSCSHSAFPSGAGTLVC